MYLKCKLGITGYNDLVYTFPKIKLYIRWIKGGYFAKCLFAKKKLFFLHNKIGIKEKYLNSNYKIIILEFDSLAECRHDSHKSGAPCKISELVLKSKPQ